MACFNNYFIKSLAYPNKRRGKTHQRQTQTYHSLNDDAFTLSLCTGGRRNDGNLYTEMNFEMEIKPKHNPLNKLPAWNKYSEPFVVRNAHKVIVFVETLNTRGSSFLMFSVCLPILQVPMFLVILLFLCMSLLYLLYLCPQVLKVGCKTG